MAAADRVTSERRVLDAVLQPAAVEFFRARRAAVARVACGDRFTAADVYAGSGIGWGMAFGKIDRRPAFERYWALINARPAAIRAREIDDRLIEERKKEG